MDGNLKAQHYMKLIILYLKIIATNARITIGALVA